MLSALSFLLGCLSVFSLSVGVAQALDVRDTAALAATGSTIRGWLVDGEMPADLAEEICFAYGLMEEEYGSDPDMAGGTTAAPAHQPVFMRARERSSRTALQFVPSCESSLRFTRRNELSHRPR